MSRAHAVQHDGAKKETARSRTAAIAPIRVLHLVHRLGAHGRTGGMEYGVIKLVNRMRGGSVVAGVCSTRLSDAAIRGLLDPGVPFYECRGRDGNDPRLIPALWRVFRQFRPDIVHTHGWGTLIEGLVAARLAGVPRVIHGEHGTLQNRWYQRWTQRIAWGCADGVVSVSGRLAERLARDVGFELSRIRTIRNGVDLERFASTSRVVARRELGIPDDVVAIGTVGRLVPVKDHATLLTAFADTWRSQPNTRLFLAGDGPLKAALQQQARELGIDTAVRFLGHRSDVEHVLAALDVFVLSSVSEGMSNTILEAMATGLPVVATAVGGADELVVDGHTGLLVAPSQPRALAAALSTLAADGGRRNAMGISGRERVVAAFTVSRMVAEYEQLYSGMCDRARHDAAGAPQLLSHHVGPSSASGDLP
jgi:sugar transferase (PEP-CTERM/EpsH1 system associated)